MRHYGLRAGLASVMLLAGMAQASEMKPDTRRVMRPHDVMRVQAELAATRILAKAVIFGAASVMLFLPGGNNPMPMYLLKELNGTN